MITKGVQSLVNEFNYAKINGFTFEELNKMADEIQRTNMITYDRHTSFVYRRDKITENELKKWERLSEMVGYTKNLKLFDSAFGSGRDLLIAQQMGYDAYGCELSDFLYNDFVSKVTFNPAKVIQCDLRNIPFPDETFDIIRHNASFLHMPLIGLNYTVHKCLTESYRLLKKEGYLYIYTKEGDGFSVIDTLDGLGPRSFQLYNEDTLNSLLNDCGFTVKCFNHYDRLRNGNHILWIEAFAQKALK